MPQALQPLIRHDARCVACLDPEAPQVIRPNGPSPLQPGNTRPVSHFSEAVQQLPRRFAEQNCLGPVLASGILPPKPAA